MEPAVKSQENKAEDSVHSGAAEASHVVAEAEETNEARRLSGAINVRFNLGEMNTGYYSMNDYGGNRIDFVIADTKEECEQYSQALRAIPYDAHDVFVHCWGLGAGRPPQPGRGRRFYRTYVNGELNWSQEPPNATTTEGEPTAAATGTDGTK